MIAAPKFQPYGRPRPEYRPHRAAHRARYKVGAEDRFRTGEVAKGQKGATSKTVAPFSLFLVAL
jgi:hypothetical protein